MTPGLTAVQLILNLTAPVAITAPAFLGVNIDTAALFQGTSPHRLWVLCVGPANTLLQHLFVSV